MPLSGGTLHWLLKTFPAPTLGSSLENSRKLVGSWSLEMGQCDSFTNNRIDNAELVIRCNHYGEILQEPLARKKLGSKCDIQFICLHAGCCFKKPGIGFLYEWIKDSKAVLTTHHFQGSCTASNRFSASVRVYAYDRLVGTSTADVVPSCHLRH